MNYKYFIWDFDGTLFDTYGRITRALIKGLHDLGIMTDFETALSRVKISLNDAAQAYINDCQAFPLSANDILTAYHIHAEEEDFSTLKPYPGVKEALSEIVHQGGMHFLYTHRGFSAIEALKRENLFDYFTDCVTSADGFPVKPAPDAILSLIDCHRLDKEKTVMIGDREIDIGSGKNAGIHTCLFDPGDFFPALQADHSCKSMSEILTTL